MKELNPGAFDPRPNRKKLDDNPYELDTIGTGTEHPRFFLSFQDGEGRKHIMEIDRILFDAFDRFELDDVSYINEISRHFDTSEHTEESLHRRTAQPMDPVTETVEGRMEAEELRRAIAALPVKQRRRLVLYYYGSLTYQEIAEMEGCSFQAVAKSVASAEIFLKFFLSEG